MSRFTVRRREVLDGDPFRNPDARWREAVAEIYGFMANSPTSRQRRREPETRRAIDYLGANGQTTFRDNPPGRVLRCFEDMWAAHGLCERGGLRRIEADARILAGQSPAEIAVIFGLDEKAFRAYLDVYFQVMDRLRARAWILAMVINPAVDRYGPEHGDIPGFWLQCAVQGGVLALELAMAVTGHREPTQSPETLARGRLLRVLRALPPMTPVQELRLRTIFQEHRHADGSISVDLFRRLREDGDLGPLVANLADAEKMLTEAS